MKQYPIAESELKSLGNMSAATTACFSLGVGLLGFSINLHKDLMLATGGASQPVLDFIKNGALIVGLIFLLLGIALFFYGRRTLDEIRAQTTFENDPSPHVIPSWPTVLLRLAWWGVLILMGVVLHWICTR